MALRGDFLRLAAIITFVVVGVLLLIADDVSLRTSLALICFGLAAFAAAAGAWWGARP
jgi:hypothetical protein